MTRRWEALREKFNCAQLVNSGKVGLVAQLIEVEPNPNYRTERGETEHHRLRIMLMMTRDEMGLLGFSEYDARVGGGEYHYDRSWLLAEKILESFFGSRLGYYDMAEPSSRKLKSGRVLLENRVAVTPDAWLLLMNVWRVARTAAEEEIRALPTDYDSIKTWMEIQCLLETGV